ncbi:MULTISPECIES: DUF3408 domain-containing protein [unclassified Flavobacterium]|uniref:DUF3408 domain-containing protein n=1 Tax=unclassified Flavobacterium TaxID=196869 RepID=UPI0006ABBB06|nr:MULTISPECIES: DUF3408 domain-containing protein [unclassified Flavobacterium]KOP38903.1 conjugal transfer protein TraB [Flavobacterium sp. VMW]OWU92853.1 conjugal transfer protein TraB [Flavobacterium sp. NLM]
MEKEQKKKAIPEINEEMMMNLMVDGVRMEGLHLPQEGLGEGIKPLREKPMAKEHSKMKKEDDQEYEILFLKKSDTNARDGKTVYIRPDFHEKLTRIVQVIGEDKISIYAYLDNLLEYHFQEFGDRIIKSFNDKYKPIL